MNTNIIKKRICDMKNGQLFSLVPNGKVYQVVFKYNYNYPCEYNPEYPMHGAAVSLEQIDSGILIDW